MARCSLLSLLFGELSLIELKLLALKNIAVATTSLPRARGNACEETTRVELISDSWVNNASLGGGFDLGLNVLGSLLLLLGLGALFNQLLIELDTIVLKIPRSERIWSD